MGRRPFATAAPGTATEQRRVLYWYDPMRPEQHFDQPGKSPFMDMQLVPRYADTPAGGAASGTDVAEAGGLHIDARVAQNLGVRYAVAELAPWSEAVDAVGSIVFDQRLVTVLQARAAGFVIGVHGRAPGERVARGAALVDVAVPEWPGAQAEYVALLKGGERELIDAARARLTLLGMPEELIRRVESSGAPQTMITITAPAAAAIDALEARVGMAVSAGATLVKLNGLDSVWLEVAVPEAQARLAAAGAPVEARITAFPGERFPGRVLAVLPEADAATRTLRLRVELANPDGRLRPGMYAQVHVQSGESRELLQVPSEAVIRTGTRDLVLLAGEAGTYTPVQVRLGAEANGRTVVLEGLSAGQRVVASGQFLIDSEASLRGLEAHVPSAAAPAAAPGVAAVDIEARGRVVEVATGMITVTHEPIAALGWPAMTMPFRLARPELAATLHAGDSIRFHLRPQGDEYLIVALERTAGAR
ncbi:MAG: efflux RND transporter periplasmic adaptor subunit [Gammaproteobacteria bacterium]|nr:efflux RND transporter periplasmic adaptor subunit [Gammaproteobacteria bacterium]